MCLSVFGCFFIKHGYLKLFYTTRMGYNAGVGMPDGRLKYDKCHTRHADMVVEPAAHPATHPATHRHHAPDEPHCIFSSSDDAFALAMNILLLLFDCFFATELFPSEGSDMLDRACRDSTWLSHPSSALRRNKQPSMLSMMLPPFFGAQSISHSFSYFPFNFIQAAFRSVHPPSTP